MERLPIPQRPIDPQRGDSRIVWNRNEQVGVRTIQVLSLDRTIRAKGLGANDTGVGNDGPTPQGVPRVHGGDEQAVGSQPQAAELGRGTGGDPVRDEGQSLSGIC